MAAPPPKRPRTDGGSDSEAEEAPGTDTTAATTLRFVDGGDDGAPPFDARPLFTHQVFDDERVEGYEDLALTVTVSRRTAHALVEAAWSSRDPDAPPVVPPLASALGDADTDAAAYAARLAAAPALDLTALGAPVATGGGAAGDVSIFCVKLAAAPPPVRALHARLAALLTLLIDGASPIDADDDAWDLLLAVHVGRGGGEEGRPSPPPPPLVAGFATLYSMYGWPDRARLRVCQVAVLPPSAGAGVGGALLEAAYGVADERGCLDVTFEDPTDDVQAMRERLEARRAARCGWFAAAAKAAAATLAAPGKGKARADAAPAAPAFPSLPPADAARARAELRITKQQVPLAFEALVAAALGLASPSLRAAVRARLAASVAPDAPPTEHKRVFEDAEGGVGFVMCKVRGGEGGPPPAAPAEEEGVAEKNAAAVEKATGMRLEFLGRVVKGLAV